jgi:hypothetical protein
LTNKVNEHSSGTSAYRIATAYHEAGHALAALKEGRELTKVVLHPVDPKTGICILRGKLKNPYDASLSRGDAAAAWQHTYQSSCADIRIGLAGPLAGSKALGKSFLVQGSMSDLKRCVYLAERLARISTYLRDYTDIGPISADELLENEKQRVRRWLGRKKVWSAISLIAETLAENGRLNSPAIGDVYGLAVTPKLQEHLNFVLQRIES